MKNDKLNYEMYQKVNGEFVLVGSIKDGKFVPVNYENNYINELPILTIKNIYELNESDVYKPLIYNNKPIGFINNVNKDSVSFILWKQCFSINTIFHNPCIHNQDHGEIQGISLSFN